MDAPGYIPVEKLADLAVEICHLVKEETEGLCGHPHGVNTILTPLLWSSMY